MHIIFLILIITIFMDTYQTANIRNKPSDSCQDPGVQDLKNSLFEIYTETVDDLIKGNDPNMRAKSPHVLDINVPSSNENTIISGLPYCLRSNQTKWDWQPVGSSLICPHHFVLVHREDRFPRVIWQAVCNCKDTDERGEISYNHYKCRPITVLRPVLVKTRNCNPSSNLYAWENRMERVAISCGLMELISMN